MLYRSTRETEISGHENNPTSHIQTGTDQMAWVVLRLPGCHDERHKIVLLHDYKGFSCVCVVLTETLSLIASSDVHAEISQ